MDLFVEETPAPTPMENTATQQPAPVAVEAANGEGKQRINSGVVRQMYPILGKFTVMVLIHMMNRNNS